MSKILSRLRGGAIGLAILSTVLSMGSTTSALAQTTLKKSPIQFTESDLRGVPVDTKKSTDKAKLFRDLPTGAPNAPAETITIDPAAKPDVTVKPDTIVKPDPAAQPGAAKPAVKHPANKVAPKTTPPAAPLVTPPLTAPTSPTPTAVPNPGQPGNTTSSKPTTAPGAAPTDTTPTPGILTPGGMPTKADIEKMIKLRHDNMSDPTKQPAPEVLEKVYHQVWATIGDKYVDQSRLKDWHLWANKYKGKLKTGEDLENALKEMVASVGDRWTKFTTFDDMFVSMARQADGIVHLGLGLARQTDGTYKIEMILYGTPAYLTNRLRTGDVVKTIEVNSKGEDGKAVTKVTELAGLTKDQADALTFAKKGSEAVLTISHDGIEEKVKVAFGEAPEAQIEVRMLPGNIGYLRLPSFGSSPGDLTTLGQGMTEALFALDEAGHGHMRGLILDLRNNPGGIVDLAQNIASLFIRDGVFLKTHESNGRFSEDKTININRPMAYNFVDMPPEIAAVVQRLLDVPMTVLVNGSSASSAEILTGSLKDNHRAIVIGTQTFGKAVAYVDQPVKPLGQLQITVMHYLTPSGYDLANKGIEPDLVIDRSRGGALDEQLAAAVEVLNAVDNAKLAGPAGSSSGPSAHNGESDFGGSSVLLIGVGLGAGLAFLYFVTLHTRKRKERDEQEKKERK